MFLTAKKRCEARFRCFEMNFLVSNHAKRYLYKPPTKGELNSYLGSPKTFHVPNRWENRSQSSSQVFWDERCSWAIMQKGIFTSSQETGSWTHILAIPRLFMFLTAKNRSQCSSRVVWDELSRQQSCKKIPLQAPKKRGVEPISRQPQNFSCSQAPKTHCKAQVGCFEMNVLVSNHAKGYLYKPPRNKELNPYLGSPKTFDIFERQNPIAKLKSGGLRWTYSWAIVQKDTFTSPHQTGT